MAITKYETKKTKVTFLINSHPNLTDDVYIDRQNKYIEFYAKLGKKFEDKISVEQAKELGLIISNILTPYAYGYLNFNLDDVLKINNAESMLGTLKVFRDTYQEQKNTLEQDM